MGFSQESIEQYKRDGFSDAEIEVIWENTVQMRKLMEARRGQEPREITSSTYERAMKRQNKNVESWFGFNRR